MIFQEKKNSKFTASTKYKKYAAFSSFMILIWIWLGLGKIVMAIFYHFLYLYCNFTNSLFSKTKNYFLLEDVDKHLDCLVIKKNMFCIYFVYILK